jgi:hypothetical protein
LKKNEIAEYIFGRVARRDGEEFDITKTLAWQRGWAEAQEAEGSGISKLFCHVKSS